MTEWAQKVFWTAVDVVPGQGGFAVALDGRMIKTPAKAPLTVPTLALAEAIAAEWRAQDGTVRPDTMPSTRAANAAIDKLTIQKAEVADMLADYGDSDLLCYRADAPDALVARQSAQWDPMLDWAAQTLGARLAPRTGVIHAPQDAEAVARLRAGVHALDIFALSAFHDLVTLTGSLVLGFAGLHDDHSPQDLWDLSRLDEDWQAEQWGHDEEAVEMAQIKRAAFLHAHGFYRLSRPAAAA